MPYPKKRKRQNDHSSDTQDKRPKPNREQSNKMLRNKIMPSPSGSRSFAAAASAVTSGVNNMPQKSPRAEPMERMLYGKSSRMAPRGFDKKSRPTHTQRGKRLYDSGNNRQQKSITQRRIPLVLYNEEYIYNNFQIPSAAEYGLTVEPVDNCTEILRNANLISQKQSQHESSRDTRYTTKCINTLELDNDIFIVATGHGRTKVEAEVNSNLHAICILHGKGLFKDILPGGKYTVATPETISQEGAAKKDIIDYAARHDCLPTFEIHHGRSRLKKKAFVTVVASIPDLTLTGLGRATREQDAFLQACISLKQAAEAHHEKTGDGLLLVKDYTKLTSASARKFMDYYCFIHHTRYELETIKARGGREWVGRIDMTIPSDKEAIPQVAEKAEPIDGHKAVSLNEVNTRFEGIPMTNKKDAEDSALLAAALALKKQESSSWKTFVKEMKRGNGEILKPVRPIDIHVDYEAIEEMRKTLRDVQRVSGTGQGPSSEDDTSALQTRRNFSRQLTSANITQKNQDLKDALDQYRNNPELDSLRQKRSELPMVQYRDEVMNIVRDNEVCVVVGATGSGKTTQLPQLILEEMTDAGLGGECNIICTQPRRIAAISVSQRVAIERNEKLQESIGYSVRFDSKLPRFGGSVNYCTTGILLRQLQDSQEATLDGISHIIIDEVHERDIQIDFLLVILRQIMADRRARSLKPIKVILMSATIDTNLFCKYFGAGYDSGRCPYIEVPGRTFPVTQHFLDEIHPILQSTYSRREASELYSRDTEAYIKRELVSPPDFTPSAPVTENNSIAGSDEDDKARINWKSQGMVGEDGELDLAMEKEDTVTPVGLMSVTIAHLLKTTTEGSILVFLPGLQEITALNRTLTTTKPLGMDFTSSEQYKIYLLHSAIPQMQQEVFEKLEPGRRKIILSTNIAETSITIPDVVYVVDSSKHRESQYDQAKRISSLVSTWTSKSNAKQRSGRAGRVQNGHYYSMASQDRYDSFETAPQPEILRTDLQELCLQIKSMGIESIGKFLRNAIEPPPVNSVEASVDHLQALRALDEEENLTPLGRLLSTLPVQPSLGKMVILAVIFKCLDPVLILAAASASKEPFLSPIDRRAEADARKASFAKGTGSDHAAIVNAFSEWRKVRTQSHDQGRSFAFENFLHYNTLVSIAQTAEQILEIMQKSGLIAGINERPFRGSRSFMSRYGTEEENANSNSVPLQVALATAGFYPNLAVQTSAPRFLRTAHENAAQIHLNSLAAPRTQGGSRYGPISRADVQPVGTLYTYSQKTQADSNNVNLRGVTKTSPFSVVLFGGKSEVQGPILRVDEWIPFFARGPQMYVTRDFSKALDEYLEKTFARLGAANQRRLLAQSDGNEGFLNQDPVREPLTRGVVRAIELCAPKESNSSFASAFSSRSSTGRGAPRGGSSGSGGYSRGGSGYQGNTGSRASREGRWSSRTSTDGRIKAISEEFFT